MIFLEHDATTSPKNYNDEADGRVTQRSVFTAFGTAPPAPIEHHVCREYQERAPRRECTAMIRLNDI